MRFYLSLLPSLVSSIRIEECSKIFGDSNVTKKHKELYRKHFIRITDGIGPPFCGSSIYNEKTLYYYYYLLCTTKNSGGLEIFAEDVSGIKCSV